jgi:broad specificity phosphatase PhoE
VTRLWCVRHGHTIWNLEERYNGLSDIPLDAFGIEQADELSKQLAQNGVTYQAIYRSHLDRARQTAEIINRRLNIPVYVDERLREIELGEWEGRTFREIDVAFPSEIAQRTSNAAHVRSPGGESALEVARRVTAAADDIVRAYPDGDVLVVAHGVSLSSLILTARGETLDQVYFRLPDHLVPVPIEWQLGERVH